MMAQCGAFLDMTFISLVQRIESAQETHLSEDIVNNVKKTVERGKQVYAWAKKHNVPIAFGTDLWGPEAQKSQLREFEIRNELDNPPDVIRSATAVNADLLLQKGKLGIIAPGAYADLLVIEGDPLTDLSVLQQPDRNLKLIMKDGALFKNELT